MVAASGEREGFRPAVAVAWFVALVAGLIALPFARDKSTVMGLEPLPHSPDRLEMKAGEMLRRLGHPEQPGFRTASGFNALYGNHDYAKSKGLESGFARHEPALLEFWYRELAAGSVHLELGELPFILHGRIQVNTRTEYTPQEALIVLDPVGRLRKLLVYPAPGAPSPGASAEPFDWNRLLAEAGLPPARLKFATPIHTPPVSADSRAAWLGSLDAAGALPVRVEAAAWQGRPVYFLVEALYAGDAANRIQVPAILVGSSFLWILVVTYLSFLAAASLKARGNLRSLSADRPGARRLFIAVFAVAFGAQAAAQSHVGGLAEFVLLLIALSWAAFSGGTIWVLYLAIEPAVRRSHPHMLVSWSRLMAGRFRDPLLASHLLAACALAALRALLANFGYGWVAPILADRLALGGPGPLLALMGYVSITFIFLSLGFILTWIFLSRLLRREWVVMLIAGLSWIPLTGPLSAPWPALLCFALCAASFVCCIRFFGLTGAVVMGAVVGVLGRPAVTSNLSAWHTSQSLWVYALVALFAVWQLRNVLRGRPLGAESETS